MSEDGELLYVALPEHNLVRAIATSDLSVRGEHQVSGGPHRLTVLADDRVAVTAQWAGTVTLLDFRRGRPPETVFVGNQPHAVVETAGSLWVVVAGEAHIARIDLSAPPRVADRLPLPHGDPRGLAVLDDGRLAVGYFKASQISFVDVDVPAAGRTRESVRDTSLALQALPFFAPNQVESMTVGADGHLLVPHVQCNNDPGQFAGQPGDPSQTAEYYVSGPSGFPAIVPRSASCTRAPRSCSRIAPKATPPMSRC